MQRTAAEITEIERHKYFLSEKQGHDVGWEFAEQDWDANFGNDWRQEQSPPNHGSDCSRPVRCSADSVEALQLDPTIPQERGTGPLLRLFAKLFAKS